MRQHLICFPHQRKCPSPLLGWCQQQPPKLKKTPALLRNPEHLAKTSGMTNGSSVKLSPLLDTMDIPQTYWPPRIALWRMGDFPLSKMHVQVVTSLKNEPGWRTPGCYCSSVARYFRQIQCSPFWPKAMLSSSAKRHIPAHQFCRQEMLVRLILSLFFLYQFEIFSQFSPQTDYYFNCFLVSFFHFMLKCSQTFFIN